MKQEKGHMFIQEGELTDTEVQNNNVLQQTVTIPGGTSTSNNTEMIRCARCGAEMKKDARYCMKCGNLNYALQENKSMKQNVIDTIKYKDYVGGLETAQKNGIEVPDEVRSYPYKSCLITNILLFLVPFLLFVAISFLLDIVNVGIIAGVGISLILLFVLAYAYQRMLIKAGEDWWSIFVPFYNMVVYFKLALGKGWYFILTFIPLVGFIVSAVASYKLAKKFNKNGWLMIFFPFIMIPLIGFDNKVYYINDKEISLKNYKVAAQSLDGKKKTNVEKSYRAKQFIFSVIVLIGFGFTVYLGWDYIKEAYEFFLKQLEFFK